MSSSEESLQAKESVDSGLLASEYYENYDTLYDLRLMSSRIEHFQVPEEIRTHLHEHERNTFLVLGSATSKNINAVTTIAHYLHGKEETAKDSVTIVDINDASIALHEKAIQELDEVSDWSKTSIRERSVETFPYPEFSVVKGDIRALPQEANSVDVAISDYTINFLDSEEDVRTFFQEVYRVLIERGILFIALRFTKGDQSPSRAKLDLGGVEVSMLRLEEYTRLAKEAGFQIVTDEGRGTGGGNVGDELLLLMKS